MKECKRERNCETCAFSRFLGEDTIALSCGIEKDIDSCDSWVCNSNCDQDLRFDELWESDIACPVREDIETLNEKDLFDFLAEKGREYVEAI
jgi:hypothetical protein